ncbi:MAG: hypothetical protein CL944_00410 [Candidatus Diapherotrites archaeon]|uniref:Uncharacterized protein n=1 Tax=Candidatus Iainarchaeum sp. TaxID=3101447 RepID=A0A2D6LNZ8_9ARCH|nr:hypothetical protein [Candidatus Diapherotrites archaeon]|tara:strand:- start:12077 stop:12277 length:201 start_codon:yes stop_codon:yes gene_type:complete
MFLRSVIEAMPLAFTLQIFFFIVDITGKVDFGIEIYTLSGFFMLWIYAYLMILVLKIGSKKEEPEK